MSCAINTANRPGRPVVGISYAEAIVQARRDLWPQRLLWPFSAYQKAFRARVELLMGVIRVDRGDTRTNAPESGVNRVHFSPEPRVMRRTHPGDPR